MLQYTGVDSIPAIRSFCGAKRCFYFDAMPGKDLLLGISRDVCFFMCLGDWIWKTGEGYLVGVPLAEPL